LHVLAKELIYYGYINVRRNQKDNPKTQATLGTRQRKKANNTNKNTEYRKLKQGPLKSLMR
jgi:DNA-binding MarR family transcriptional regulator